jgi:general secretion pathway protein D
MQVFKVLPLSIVIILAVSGCQNTQNKPLGVNPSYLNERNEASKAVSPLLAKDALKVEDNREFAYLKSLETNRSSEQQVLELVFSEQEMVTLSSEDLAVKDFLHYVFGELLEVSYILGDIANSDEQSLTLNLQNKVSKRRLFVLSEQLLNQRGYIVRVSDGVYYIHKEEQGGKSEIVFGYGNTSNTVPVSNKEIVQYVPYQYGDQVAIIGTINQLFNVKAMPAAQKNAMSIKGKRNELLKVLDFINMLDRPNLANKHVALYSPVYVGVSELSDKLKSLLQEDGITFTSKGEVGKAVSSVLLERSGKIVMFATKKMALNRVQFWLEELDQPSKGNEKKYHIYQPNFARATDLGQSLQLLIGGKSTPPVNNRTSASDENKGVNNASQNSTLTANNKDMRLVVDERSNSLIIESAGDKYRDILPLIKRLDVMPKQVMLEVIIAEVQLSGEFEQGIEFTLTNRLSNSTRGNGNLSGAAGTLNYILKGASGDLTLNFLETNTNIDILSRPSLVVRDGVSATINAGDNVPTLGKILTDPNIGAQQSVEYRKTGIQLTVTPTINAQGVVIMEIDQTTSNAAEGSSAVEGAPIFTERTITTEVVAESGQTVVLGGLIRENKTDNDSHVPFFSELPIVGKLFQGKSQSTNKVELVVMVTPKIIESSESWDDVKKRFTAGFQYLSLSGE